MCISVYEINLLIEIIYIIIYETEYSIQYICY